jgi:two-component system OmpR family sensor kinase
VRMPGRSLRARIVWTTTVVATIAMGAMIGTVVLVLNQTASNSVDTALSDRLDVASATLKIGPDGRLTELETPDDAIDASTWIFDPSGREVDGPRASKRVRAKVETLARVSSRTLLESHDRVYLATPVRDGSGGVKAVIVVTESMGPYETTRIVVLTVLAALAVLVVVGSGAVAAWTMRRALGPVEEMATLATDWSEHDLEARFDSGESRSDEISTLGHTLNVLLDRVAGALRNEQQLTAELAHELRTPLTAIRGEAELALMHASDEATSTRLERVVDLVERMNVTIGTLLAAARGHTERGTPGNAADIVASVFADHPQESRLSWTIDVGDHLPVAAPVDLAGRALAPLVDNAARFARTSVTISAAARGRTVEIMVTDDGGGVGVDDVEGIFTAGHRRSDGDGAGLGLALSRRVARTLGGDVTVRSPASPTSFVLTLPRF